MWQDIQAAIPLGVLMGFVIGPVFFVLLETSAIKGFRAALVFDFGVILADVLFIVLAYFSSFQLLENLSNQPGLYVFGGFILLIYGLITFVKRTTNRTSRKKDSTTGIKKNRGYLGLFAKGFLLNFINVGVLVFWLGVIIVVGPSLDNDPNRMVTFFSTMLSAYLLVDIVKIVLAKQLKRKLTSERIRIIKMCLGIILMFCGIVLITKGFLPKDQFNIEKGLEQIDYYTD